MYSRAEAQRLSEPPGVGHLFGALRSLFLLRSLVYDDVVFFFFFFLFAVGLLTSDTCRIPDAHEYSGGPGGTEMG